MRFEFQIRRAGSPESLIDTTYADLEEACDALGDEPEWAGFFVSPRFLLRPYPAKGGRAGGYSRAETLAALEGLRARLGPGAPDLAQWLAWAAARVGKEDPSARFESCVMDD